MLRYPDMGLDRTYPSAARYIQKLNKRLTENTYILPNRVKKRLRFFDSEPFGRLNDQTFKKISQAYRHF